MMVGELKYKRPKPARCSKHQKWDILHFTKVLSTLQDQALTIPKAYAQTTNTTQWSRTVPAGQICSRNQNKIIMSAKHYQHTVLSKTTRALICSLLAPAFVDDLGLLHSFYTGCL